MIDLLRDLPAAQLAALVCLSFVGFTWLGIITLRPMFRWFVRAEPDINGVVGNFVSNIARSASIASQPASPASCGMWSCWGR